MSSRFLYTVCMFWRHRQQLRQYYDASLVKPVTFEALDLIALKDGGVKALVLDYDGVLSPHACESLSQPVIEQLHKAVHIFKEGGVYLLSNRPSQERQALIKTISPHIHFIWPKRKKPYPDDLCETAKQLNLPTDALLMVDDRLATGVLAACIAKTKALYIHPAKRHIMRHPISECFFMLLRWLERRIV